MTTKILALTDALGNLVKFVLMPGQRHDTKGVRELIADVRFDALLADKAFDVNWLIQELDKRGAQVVMHDVGAGLDGSGQDPARIDATVNGTPTTIDGDPVLLRRLLRNLLENALKHGARPIEIEIGPLATGGARVVVCDRGPGMAAAEHARVFEPFYRPGGAAESAGSWGLGLSLVRKLVRDMNGNVSHDRDPRAGLTHFRLHLPQAARQN